ncbi:MAG: TetR/AcrR family transcriptional regulator [Solirubrobacteraceae bacterium]|nr:TetR/AcrR family transcriptional regulator [Solirubrobacteraceae bacterium]
MTTPRRSSRGNRTVEAILAAAEPQFLEHGFAGTKVDDVAEAAAVGVGTVYVHFESKDGLYGAVLLRAQEIMVCEYLDPVFDLDLPPWERIEAWCHAYLRFAEEHESRMRLIALSPFAGTALAPEELDAPFRARIAESNRRLMDLFTEAGESGLLRDLDPMLVSRFVSASVYGMCMMNLRHRPLQLEPDTLRAALTAGLTLLADGHRGHRFRRSGDAGQIDA